LPRISSPLTKDPSHCGCDHGLKLGGDCDLLGQPLVAALRPHVRRAVAHGVRLRLSSESERASELGSCLGNLFQAVSTCALGFRGGIERAGDAQQVADGVD
jgi:hypothetical protein